MKNIHLIATDKPSRVYKHLDRELKHTVRYFEQKGLLCINQHIYITSDEGIKDGDWGLSKLNEVILFGRRYNEKLYKKIILTTDHGLIKDGVQAIADEFLQWFVKNPSCESIEVESGLFFYAEGEDRRYKIIIPQEEHPKQIKCYCGHTIYCDCSPLEEPKQEENEIIDISDHDGIGNAVDNLNNEPPQETLEEALNKLKEQNTVLNLYPSNLIQNVAEFGANWQAKRMYSEEEIFNLCRDFAIFVQQKRPSYKKKVLSLLVRYNNIS
jgi:hypothetical protein